MPLYVDSSGVVSMVFNPVDHSSNKHVKLACHYVRELAVEKFIAPNLADLFTKPVAALSSKFSFLA